MSVRDWFRFDWFRRQRQKKAMDDRKRDRVDALEQINKVQARASTSAELRLRREIERARTVADALRWRR